MNRRKFLKMLGIVPLAPFVIKQLNIKDDEQYENDKFHPYSTGWSVRCPYPKLTHQYKEGEVRKYNPDKDAWLL